MYLFDYKKDDKQFNGTYLFAKYNYDTNYHYDIIRQSNLNYLIDCVEKSNNPYKDKIVKLLKDDNVAYRFNKKYIAINFKKLLTDATVNNIDITIPLEKDFENLSKYTLNKIKREPLILSFPFKDFNSRYYFIKTDNPPKINKFAYVNQISIGMERLHRICATIDDEFVVSTVECVLKSDQMFNLICNSKYCLNFELIYNNFESANPYAFEAMINELFDKTIITGLLNNPNYLPKNRYFKFVSNNKKILNNSEFNKLMESIKNVMQANVMQIKNYKLQPIFNEKLIQYACNKLLKELEKDEITNLIKSGELVIDNGKLINDLKVRENFNPHLLNILLQACIDIKQMQFYLEKSEVKHIGDDLLNTPSLEF